MAGRVTVEREGAVRFGLLGPLQVVDAAGAARVVSAAKQRVVLVALLLAEGSAVPAASMAEVLWDESPPPNAPAVMRTYLTRLRRALGPAGSRIVSQPAGWAAELRGPGELDLAEVESLRRTALAAAAAGEWRRASSLLGRARGLWRGDPLADIPPMLLPAARWQDSVSCGSRSPRPASMPIWSWVGMESW